MKWRAVDLLVFVTLLGASTVACATTDETQAETARQEGGSGGSKPEKEAGQTAGALTGDTAGQQSTAESGPSLDADVAEVREDYGMDAGGRADAIDAPVIASSCAGGLHPVCLDFESGKVPSDWQAPSTSSFHVEKGHAAHGEYAMHVANLRTKPSALMITSAMNGIKDVMWGRYYVYLSPGAPWGHGAMVWVGDALSPTNWYEVGFESNAYLGMWIQGDGWLEKYMRSTAVVPGDKWVCVEFFFDGATPSVGRYWSDGSEIIFDPKRIAGTDPIQNYAGPAAVLKAQQFKTFKVGVEFYHGSSLVSCPQYPPFLCPSYNNDDAPYMTDIWIDDVALDTRRVGCL